MRCVGCNRASRLGAPAATAPSRHPLDHGRRRGSAWRARSGRAALRRPTTRPSLLSRTVRRADIPVDRLPRLTAVDRFNPKSRPVRIRRLARAAARYPRPSALGNAPPTRLVACSAISRRIDSRASSVFQLPKGWVPGRSLAGPSRCRRCRWRRRRAAGGLTRGTMRSGRVRVWGCGGRETQRSAHPL